MAKPDLDDGWFKVAYELLPPLMMCCQRVEASIVLCEVLAQTYGRGKRKTAKLEPVKIAARTGRKREYIWKGIRELTANGVIEKMGDGTYRFEKDYEKWGTAEKPLVERPLARYFAAFPLIAKSFDPAPGPVDGGYQQGPQCGPWQGPISEPAHESEPDPCGPSQGPLSGYQQGPQCGPSQGPETAPPPIRELENGRVVAAEVADEPSESGPGIGSDNASAPAVARPSAPIRRGPDGKPLIWSMAPFKHERGEVERIADLCGEYAGPDEDTIPGNVRRSAAMYPLWYFVHAIRLGITKGYRGGLWSFAVGIMQQLWIRGIEDESQLGPAERPTPLGVFPSPSAAPAPRLTAYQAKEAAEKAKMKDYVPPSLRGERKS